MTLLVLCTEIVKELNEERKKTRKKALDEKSYYDNTQKGMDALLGASGLDIKKYFFANGEYVIPPEYKENFRKIIIGIHTRNSVVANIRNKQYAKIPYIDACEFANMICGMLPLEKHIEVFSSIVIQTPYATQKDLKAERSDLVSFINEHIDNMLNAYLEEQAYYPEFEGMTTTIASLYGTLVGSINNCFLASKAMRFLSQRERAHRDIAYLINESKMMNIKQGEFIYIADFMILLEPYITNNLCAQKRPDADVAKLMNAYLNDVYYKKINVCDVFFYQMDIMQKNLTGQISVNIAAEAYPIFPKELFEVLINSFLDTEKWLIATNEHLYIFLDIRSAIKNDLQEHTRHRAKCFCNAQIFHSISTLSQVARILEINPSTTCRLSSKLTFSQSSR